jgi:hypothetical protein
MTMEITIAAGPANARTISGLRYYRWMGRELPSVTTIQRMAGVPHNLHTWAISQVVDRAVGRADVLNTMLTRERRPREKVLEKNRVAEASLWLRQAATEERDRAAALGTATHDYAAAGAVPGQVPDVVEVNRDGRITLVDGARVRAKLSQFIDFLAVSGAQVLASEFQVFNLSVGYGGSGDLIVLFPSGRIVLVYIKTGNSVVAEHALQVGAYRWAEFSGRDDVVDERTTGFLRGVVGTGILHLDDDWWEYLALKDDPSAFDAFRGLLTFATWTAARPAAESITDASRSNRRCFVCHLPLPTTESIDRPILLGGELRHVKTHRLCTPGESAGEVAA